MAKMGRPTALNDLVAHKFFGLIEKGVARRAAAHVAGVSSAVVSNWIARGRKGEEPYNSFLARYRTSQGTAETAATLRVLEGASGWQGAAWWLERARRKTWRRPIDYVTPTTANLELLDMTDEALTAELEAFKKTGTGT